MKKILNTVFECTFVFLFVAFMTANVNAQQTGVLFTNVNIFDGENHTLHEGRNVLIDDEFANPQTGPNRLKQLMVSQGTERAFLLAKKHNVKIAWGTDMLFNPAGNRNQGSQLAKLTKWFTPAELLVMATSNNAQLLKLSGERNPYPGDLGVVKEGAYADLLLVQGNPLQDIDLIRDPATNFVVIMKDGKIYKNTIQ